MSEIENVLGRLSTVDVPFRPLASLGKRNSGTAITAAKMKTLASLSGPIRVFAGGATLADVAEEAIPAKDIIREPSIIVKSRGHIGFTYYDQPFTHKSELWSYTVTDESVDQKFVYYYLLTKLDFLRSVAKATSVKLPQLAVRDTDSLQIPVPPIYVQREIVQILDSFTELEAELEARKKQYEFYRNQLLTFPEQGGVRWVPMGEVGTFIRGNGMQKSDLQDQGSSAIHYGQVHSTYGTSTAVTKSFVANELAKKLRAAQPGNLVIATTSEDDESVAKAVAWLGESEAYVSGDAYIFKHELNPTFVAHFFQTHQFQKAKREYITGTKVRRINGDALAKIPIPVPSRSAQDEIASILDKFELLVSDISIGLPAELAARRKQYEHYRDKLLNFKELDA